jgi:hypothetical protein
MTRSRDVADTQDNLGGAVAPFVAGKNKIINGDFGVNQRSFTSTTSSGTYGFDRWLASLSGATGTYSAQTFTLGTAPVAGYEAKNFARLEITTGNDFSQFRQIIESVRTFAGQTITVSFWAKGTNPTTDGGLYTSVTQNFGTGGSPSGNVDLASSKFVLTSSWTRYSFTFNLASIAGKTIGTNNNDGLIIGVGQWTSASTDAWTLDIWGVQVEAGSVATPFQTATGTIQGELAACKRYYQFMQLGDNGIVGNSYSTTAATALVFLEEEMRAAPTVTLATAGQTSGLITFITSAQAYPATTGTQTADRLRTKSFRVNGTGYVGLTNASISLLYATGTTTVYTASAEL